MLNRCSKCGTEDSYLNPVVCDRIPLIGQTLCNRCRTQSYLQNEIIAIFLLGFLYVFFKWQLPPQEFDEFIRPLGTMCLISITQWFLIIPHELGHAFAARMFGFKNIWIQIGLGKPLWSGTFFGFPLHFRRIPIGGITSADDSDASRRDLLAFVAGGPLITALPIIPILIVSQHSGTWLPPFGSFVGICFWAHAIVLLINLFPWKVSTSSGLVDSDGLQLLKLLLNRTPRVFMSGKTYTESSSTGDDMPE
jgi:hypothetical protein